MTQAPFLSPTAFLIHPRSSLSSSASPCLPFIQGAFPLTDGSGVIVTVASYITPKHVPINGIGLKPDLKVDLVSR